LSASEALEVERACSGFESDWQEGKRPLAEERLAAAAGRVRAGLLKELLLLEVAYRRPCGGRATPGGHPARLPAPAPLLPGAFERLLGAVWEAVGAPPEEPAPPPPAPVNGEGPASSPDPSVTLEKPPDPAVPVTAEPARGRDELPSFPGYEVLGRLGKGAMG